MLPDGWLENLMENITELSFEDFTQGVWIEKKYRPKEPKTPVKDIMKKKERASTPLKEAPAERDMDDYFSPAHGNYFNYIMCINKYFLFI